MRKTLLTYALLLLAVVTMAVPARPGIWRTITLADGTEVRVELKGDEHLGYWQSADGRCFLALENKRFVEADAQQMKTMRTAAMSRVSQLRKAQANTMQQARQRAAYSGQRKGLVILVQYTDVKFAEGHDREKYLNIMNTENYTTSEGFIGSASDYFRDQSNGLFELTFDVAGPYTLAHERKYYGANRYDSQGNRISDVRADDMIKEALKLADNDVNYADYLWDDSNQVPQVYVLYAGYGEADSNESDAVWPHMSYISNGYYTGYVTYDGVRLSRYACGNEIHPSYSGYGGDVIEGIGTFCHEFSHCLGYPDFYDTQYGGNHGTGSYDLMCNGPYNGGSFCPAGYTSYEKMVAGWVEPVELKDEDVSVASLAPLSENGGAYVIYNPAYSNEYYLIENRQQSGWDRYLPGSGLMVLHVDYDKTLWDYNIPNTAYEGFNDHERMAYFKANNNDSEAGHPYPYRSNDSLTVTSSPAATLYHNNSDGSKLMHKGLKNIRRNSDKTMAFDFIANDQLDETEFTELYESFDHCAGKGGNDNMWSGATIGMAKFVPDVNGWEGDEITGANKCVKSGTASAVGSITSPLFYVDGESYLSFNAAPFGSDGTELKLSLVKQGNGTVKLEETSVTMTTRQWTTYQQKLTGTGYVRVKFTPVKRFFLDEFRVSKNAASGISDLRLEPVNASRRIYTIDGRYVGTDLSSLKSGLYIVNGKKLVK